MWRPMHGTMPLLSELGWGAAHVCYKHGAPNGAGRCLIGHQWDTHARPMSLRTRLFLFERFEDIALIVRYLVLLEEGEIFLPKGLARMVFHLFADIINHAAQL